MNDLQLPSVVSIAWLLQHKIAPVAQTRDRVLTVLAANPADTLALDVLAAVTHCDLVVQKTDAAQIEIILLEQAAEKQNSTSEPSKDIESPTDTTNHSSELLAYDPDHPEIVRLVNTLLTQAVQSRASDIHLEPEHTTLKIRYRIDGLLEDRAALPSHQAGPVVNRIKVISRMDVSNRISPQDGACSVTFGGSPVDIRVSSIPTPAGERVVLRLLGRSSEVADLTSIGLPQPVTQQILAVLNQNQGMFLVAGPTGSGKTTTLYACLKAIDTSIRNTITIEDPVEYDIPGISQVQVGQQRQLSFGQGLRSLLRQDPDIIMVGEIRDGDTAGTAHQAALTGHLILSTIHTMDPAAAVIRLLDLGVEPPLIAETLTAVMDQRLLRKCCPHCNQNPEPNESQTSRYCPQCRHTGYLGRTGLFRFLGSSPELRQAIRKNDHQTVREIVDAGCGNMLQNQARELHQRGITDAAEIIRVLGPGALQQ